MGAFEILDNISGYHEYDISDARNLRFVSDSLCRMTGYSKNELIDSEGGYAGILCEDDRETYLSFLRRMASGEGDYSEKYRIKKKDGNIICVKDSVNVKREKDGRLIGYSVVIDITDAYGDMQRTVLNTDFKCADKSIVSNNNLSFLNDTVPCGFIKYTCENQPKITYINKNMLDFLRFSENKDGEADYYEMYKNNLFLLIPVEERHRFSVYLNKVYRAGVPVAGEMTLLRFDGSRVQVFGWVTKVINEDGTEEFHSVCMDVTKRQLARKDRETRRYIKALSEVYDKIFEYNFAAETVKCLYSNNSPMFTWLENIPMQLADATRKWITDTVDTADVERVQKFFAEFADNRRKLQDTEQPLIINYHARSSDGHVRAYSGIFLKIDENISFYCCRRLVDHTETERLRSENESLKENMTQLIKQFTDGVAAFKVTADGYVLPLYSSENVCGFFGYSSDEWNELMKKGTPIEDFVERSATEYEAFEKLLKDGEEEFIYEDITSKTAKKVRAVCTQKTSDNVSSRYIMLYIVPENEADSVGDTDVMGNAVTEKMSCGGHKITIRTFGYFDVFVDGRPIAFRNKKSKELFALLVDRRGGFVTSEEAISFLWEDEPASPVIYSRYRKVALRLKNLLEEYEIADVVEAVDGKRRIICERVSCDLYDYLSGNEKYSQLFKGSYLTNYSWCETTLGELYN